MCRDVNVFDQWVWGGSMIRSPFISIIIPVRDEEACIARTLDGVLTQEYPGSRFEVLVVDGGSTDRTRDIVQRCADRHDNLRLLHNHKRLSSAARNIGVRASRGDILVIVDGHCDLENKRYLVRLAEAFERSGADCVGRPQPLEVAGGTAFQRAIAAARAAAIGHHPGSFIYSSGERFVPAHSVAVAYRRDVFDKVGYFDESFDACEDVEFNCRVDRAGLRCYFTSAVAIHYHPRHTLRALFRQLGRYGRGRVRLTHKHPDRFSINSYLPGVFVLGCIAGCVLVWLSSYLAVAYLATLTAYTAIVLCTSGAVALQRRDTAILPWLPLVFITIHVGAGVGILHETLLGWFGMRTPVRQPETLRIARPNQH